MKKISLIVILISMISSSSTAQNTVLSSFLMKWNNSKNYLIEIAEAMPEENFNYKPTEREMSFKEQLIHIRSNMIWLSETYFTTTDYKKSEKINPKTKQEVINELTNAFIKVEEIIEKVEENDLTTEVDFFAGPKSKLQILNLLQDHVSHHRGQLIVYLNLNSIIPPKYTGW